MVMGYFLQYVCKSFTMKALIMLHQGCVCWVSHKRREYSMSTATAAASAWRKYCYGHCASQERVSIVLGHAMAAAMAAASARRE